MKKKIIFICPYPYDLQAGQRLKYELHFDILRKNNYEIHIESFFDEDAYKILHKKGFFLKKIFSTIKGYIKRLRIIFSLKNFEIAYIHMWVTPFFGIFFEKIYRNFSKKIIYDIEDNILIKKISSVNPLIYFFKSNKKTIFLLRRSDYVISSAPELNNYIKKNYNNNSTFIAPSFNLNKFIPKEIKYQEKIVIGWTGTISSKKYLKFLKPILINLNKEFNFKFLLITNFDYLFPEIDCEVIQWKRENEIIDLKKIDIGLYPLPNDANWVMGKSGLKALQYMAIGIPVISSNIGNSKNIIKHNENGFLAKNSDEWYELLSILLKDIELRKKIGKNAYNTIKNFYSLDLIGNKYLNIFNYVLNK